jgi:ATP-dependent Clp protease ATP-binding subunit ClpA
LIWKMAAREMAAGRFSEIEPEHYCMALLKLADMPWTSIAAAAEGEDAARGIASDCESLRETMRKCGIESTRARRALRSRLGRGGELAQPAKVHRSPASRALFESAAMLASRSGREALEPLHLLTALFESPSPAIAETVLGRLPAPPTRIAGLLEEKARDLVQDARNGNVLLNSAVITAAKVLLQLLARATHKSTLLVTERDELAKDVASAVALIMAGDDSPAGLRERKIIDISGALYGDVNEGDGMRPATGRPGARECLRQLLAEAATRPEVILWVPSVESDSSFGIEWNSLLREALAKRTVQFIYPVTPESFTNNLNKDAVWKRHAEAVWLDCAAEDTVPRKL